MSPPRGAEVSTTAKPNSARVLSPPRTDSRTEVKPAVSARVTSPPRTDEARKKDADLERLAALERIEAISIGTELDLYLQTATPSFLRALKAQESLVEDAAKNADLVRRATQAEAKAAEAEKQLKEKDKLLQEKERELKEKERLLAEREKELAAVRAAAPTPPPSPTPAAAGDQASIPPEVQAKLKTLEEKKLEVVGKALKLFKAEKEKFQRTEVELKETQEKLAYLQSLIKRGPASSQN